MKFITLAFVLTLLCSCTYKGVQTLEKHKLESDQIIIPAPMDTTMIVVLELNDTFLQSKDRTKTNLTKIESSKLEELIKNRIEEYNKEQASLIVSRKKKFPNKKFEKTDFVVDLSDYRRQYIPYLNKKGEKEVWVNCFCAVHDDRWKKAVYIVSDGGNCFFNLTINLTLNRVVTFEMNGYA